MMGFIDYRSWNILSLTGKHMETILSNVIGLFGNCTICDSSSHSEAFDNWQYEMDLAFTAKTEEATSHAPLGL